jgi:hypothetical protein
MIDNRICMYPTGCINFNSIEERKIKMMKSYVKFKLYFQSFFWKRIEIKETRFCITLMPDISICNKIPQEYCKTKKNIFNSFNETN